MSVTQKELTSLPVSEKIVPEELNEMKNSVFSSKNKAEAKIVVDLAKVNVSFFFISRKVY